MSILMGLGLVLFLLPMNMLLLKRVKTMSVTLTNMYITISFLMSLFIIFIYAGLVIMAFKPEMWQFGMGIFISIFLNLVFKVVKAYK